MQQLENSIFRIVSIGYSAVNKERGTHDIEVLLAEKNPFSDGEISDNVEKFEAKGEDSEGGNAFDVSLESTSTVKATWFPLGNTNRKSSPDIRRGEPVIVFRMGDADKYYWVEWQHRETLRRLETVIWSISNESKENKEVTSENSYWMVASTHDKHVRLHTSKSDGEPYEYDIEINTKEGTLSIRDDYDNIIYLNSAEKIIHIENRDKSLIEVNKTVINMESRAEINLKTRKYTLTASDSITETAGNTFSIKTKDYNVTGTKFAYKSNTTTMNLGTLTITGDTIHNGNTATNGNAFEASSSGPNNMK